MKNISVSIVFICVGADKRAGICSLLISLIFSLLWMRQMPPGQVAFDQIEDILLHGLILLRADFDRQVVKDFVLAAENDGDGFFIHSVSTS